MRKLLPFLHKNPRARGEVSRGKGVIAFFARHPTAANLLMVLAFVAGISALSRLNTQFFPDFGIDVITVNVEWSGAAAEDIDTTIIRTLEPELRFLNNVDRVSTRARRGAASISIEFKSGTNMQEALSNVEAALSSVTTLPDGAERPEVSRINRYETISRIVLSGPFAEGALKVFAKRMRDDLLNAGIDRVTLRGIRNEEVLVEVDPEQLRARGLVLENIADRIRASSQDLPSGELAGGERQIRSIGLRRDASSVAEIEILTLANGGHVKLGDIATVTEDFDRNQAIFRRKGNPAIELLVQRTTAADAIKTGRILERYMEGTAGSFPQSLHVERYDEAVDLINDRIDLLVRNAAGGLFLVVVLLFLFLNARAAIWIALGIPISILLTFVIMLFTGQTINMISLFALIMTIGIVVDDAIVVGEHTETLFHAGHSADKAAIDGAMRMFGPVTAATLTTIAAFMPLLLISGVIGQIMSAIPMVAITVLLASLFESFFILPGHMRHAFQPSTSPSFIRRFFAKIPVFFPKILIPVHFVKAARSWIDQRFEWFRQQLFRRFAKKVVRYRHTVIVSIFSALMLSITLLASGRIGFTFFDAPEADQINASLEMIPGTSRKETAVALRAIEQALDRATLKVEPADPNIVVMALSIIGQDGDHFGRINVQLRNADQRATRTQSFIKLWRSEIPRIPNLANLSLRAPIGGPPGRDVDVRISGDDPHQIKLAAEHVRQMLQAYPEVSAIADSLPYGKPEDILKITPRGRALQIDTSILGRQLRNALDGAIATRFARGDEEVVVRVRYPDSAIQSGALDQLWLRAPSGAEMRLADVVERTEIRGFASIPGYNGTREVAITADLDTSQTSTNQIIQRLERDGIRARVHPLGLRYAGRSEEQSETFADLKLGGMLGLVCIYLILAWIFASYLLPLIVMVIIPFGLIGVVWGHYLLGYNLSVLSLIGMAGLSGIIVNDSIVLVTTIRDLSTRMKWRNAIVEGAVQRLRAVLLTSLTTIGGMLPLLFETSLQARFLIPMAITLIFGLMVGTILVLVAVPAFLGFWKEGLRLGPHEDDIPQE